MTLEADKPDADKTPQTLRCEECGRELSGCYHVRDGVTYCLMCASVEDRLTRDSWMEAGE